MFGLLIEHISIASRQRAVAEIFLAIFEPQSVVVLVAHEKARCSPFLTLFRGLIQLFVLHASQLLGSFSLKVTIWCLAVSLAACTGFAGGPWFVRHLLIVTERMET